MTLYGIYLRAYTQGEIAGVSFKNSNKKNFYFCWIAMRTKMGMSTMADSCATLSRSVSSRPSRQFLNALLLRKAEQAPMLTGKHLESLRP